MAVSSTGNRTQVVRSRASLARMDAYWVRDSPCLRGAQDANLPERTMKRQSRRIVFLGLALIGLTLSAETAKQSLHAAEAETKATLSQSLTLHASFDQGLDADFARGD